MSEFPSFIEPKWKTGALLLSDGSLFTGHFFGAESDGISSGVVGELVFNTAMSGYQEILTDPSYCDQIVLMTYPLIGNYGMNAEDVESRASFLKGFVVFEYSELYSNYRANESLQDYLVRKNIPALCGIDTRAVTRHIRDKGAMNASILSPAPETEAEIATALSRLQKEPPFGDRDLTAEVTCDAAYDWKEGTDKFHSQWRKEKIEPTKDQPKVVVLDLGCKLNSLRCFTERGCEVEVVPAPTTAADLRALNPNGIFISNGPGDPEKVESAVTAVRDLLGEIPIFGICMGHQVLCRAIGAKTYKMKFGHHGANQPVLDVDSGRVMITSQNHGYAVDADSLPKGARVTQINLNDKSVEGITFDEKRAFSVQYHPEASPGPRDAESHFDQFVSMLN